MVLAVTLTDKQRANSKDEDPTGLLNEGFRYRDIETGVWLSRDPAGFVDGPNLYAYVKQNPWSAFDPHGLADQKTKAGVRVTRDGQHVSPAETWDKHGLSHDVQKALNNERIPSIDPVTKEKVPHKWSRAHITYNSIADEKTGDFVQSWMKKGGASPGALTGSAAETFAKNLTEHLKTDSYISEFNGMIEAGKGTKTNLNKMLDAKALSGAIPDKHLSSGTRALLNLGKTFNMAKKGAASGAAIFAAIAVAGADEEVLVKAHGHVSAIARINGQSVVPNQDPNLPIEVAGLMNSLHDLGVGNWLTDTVLMGTLLD